MKQKEYSTDDIDAMLYAAYSGNGVPENVAIRLENQLACRRVMDTDKVSLWWLPATISTVLCAAFSIIYCIIYCILNIRGAASWIPNLLQAVSGIWLKIHLTALVLDIAVSWIITFVGIWKGNLFRGAKIF